eukprot:1350818-Alexandrium_andersonii.AAC.1
MVYWARAVWPRPKWPLRALLRGRKPSSGFSVRLSRRADYGRAICGYRSIFGCIVDVGCCDGGCV